MHQKAQFGPVFISNHPDKGSESLGHKACNDCLGCDTRLCHSFRTHFWAANMVCSSCLHPSVLLIHLSVQPCGELDSETQLKTNPVKELKKIGLIIFLIQLRSTRSSAALQKSGNGTTEEPPLE